MSIKQAIFQLNGEDYGLDITDVNIIEKDISLIEIKNAPDNMKGKIDLRGKEIPVYNLRRKFGLEDKEPDLMTRFLIITIKGIDFALEVDHVSGIKDIDETHIYKVPSIIESNNTSYIKNIANIGEGLILILDSSLLIDQKELKAMKEILKKKA